MKRTTVTGLEAVRKYLVFLSIRMRIEEGVKKFGIRIESWKILKVIDKAEVLINYFIIYCCSSDLLSLEI